MFNTFNAWLMYGEGSNVSFGVDKTVYNIFLYDVQKLEFNKAESEVSFEFVTSVFQDLNVSNGNVSKSCGIAKSQYLNSLILKLNHLLEKYLKKMKQNYCLVYELVLINLILH